MNLAGTMQLEARGEREIIVTRAFDATRTMVFRAFTEPKLLKRWLLGPPGWELTVCEMDLKVGGAYRWLWRHEMSGNEMGIRGVFREVVPPGRIVHTERFDQEWYPGEALVISEFVEQDGRTTLQLTLRYESVQARDIALKSPMESGMAAGYDRLDDLLESHATPAGSADKTDLVLTRIIDAPVEAVWAAWTQPDLVMRWWGPDGFTAPMARIDFREGGTSLVCMHSPRFGNLYSTWRYREIEPKQRIEYIHNLADENGTNIDPGKIGMPPDFPIDQRHTVVFRAVDNGRTEVIVTEHDWPPGRMMELARLGLSQCLHKMAAIFA